MKNTSTDLCGNGLLQNDFTNALCEIRLRFSWVGGERERERERVRDRERERESEGESER